MPKNSAPQEKKVNAAVRFLQTTTGVKVPQAMIVAGFLKEDIANKIMRQMIRRRYQQANNNTPAMINNVVIGEELSLSDLTNNNDVQSPTLTTSGSTKPKRKQIRLNARAKQQHRVDDLKVRDRKLDAHKAEICLYHAEQQKPNGMSIHQVRAVILKKYDVCPSRATISRYSNEGLFNVSPKKTGPIGHLSVLTYRRRMQSFLRGWN
jgi:hypothetical protein